MDFSLSPELQELQQRTRAFIRDKIIPLEGDRAADRITAPPRNSVANWWRWRRPRGWWRRMSASNTAGWGCRMSARPWCSRKPAIRCSVRSRCTSSRPTRATCICWRPLLRTEQKERWLRPLAAGRDAVVLLHDGAGAGRRIGSGGAEDHGGEGRQPLGHQRRQMVHHRRRRRGLRDHHGEGRGRPCDDVPGRHGHARDRDRPADGQPRQAFAGGHAVVRFNDLRVPASDILGEPGKGFRYAQVRLAPARLTHCMRWLGAARRAHEIATDYALRREVFGAKLIGHEGVGFMLADNEMDIRMSRLSILHTAWMLDQGARGTTKSSMSKVFVSEAVWRVVDRCVQVLGGQGVTGETLVARIFNEVRGFRIYDGPSEVHRWSLAQRIARNGANW